VSAGEPPPVPSPTDFVGTMIPSGNKPALVAYYCGLFSLLPCIGIPLGIVAIVAGIRGIRLERRHPQVRGGLHAWFGLVAGAFFVVTWLVVLALVIAASRSR
jgi:hypothetical protein